MLARFSSPAEVITDNGGEFEGAFQELLFKYMIEHRLTSSQHPQANGLAERTVKTVKSCVTRYVTGTNQPNKWDVYLAHVAEGYSRPLYTSDAADESHRVNLGGDRVMKKNQTKIVD